MKTLFLVSTGKYGETPDIYDNFKEAEEKLLKGLLSSMVKCLSGGFSYTINTVTIPYNWKDKIRYNGRVKLENNIVNVSVKREWSQFGSENEFEFSFPRVLGE